MRIKTRGLTSLVLGCTFSVTAISGVVLYIKPKGRVANWTGWTLGGLDKSEWEAVHTNTCLMLLVVAAVHLYFNWKVFWNYVKTKTEGMNLKTEMVLAVALVAGVVAGTIFDIPPFQTTARLGSSIKNYWETTSELGPAPHAEEFTVGRFARSIGLSEPALVAVLEQEGLAFDDIDTTIAQLAADNGLSPAEVYTAVTKHYPRAIRNAPTAP